MPCLRTFIHPGCKPFVTNYRVSSRIHEIGRTSGGEFRLRNDSFCGSEAIISFVTDREYYSTRLSSRHRFFQRQRAWNAKCSVVLHAAADRLPLVFPFRARSGAARTIQPGAGIRRSFNSNGRQHSCGYSSPVPCAHLSRICGSLAIFARPSPGLFDDRGKIRSGISHRAFLRRRTAINIDLRLLSCSASTPCDVFVEGRRGYLRSRD